MAVAQVQTTNAVGHRAREVVDVVLDVHDVPDFNDRYCLTPLLHLYGNHIFQSPIAISIITNHRRHSLRVPRQRNP